ncbi:MULTISPECIES: phage portal protein [unclassified Fusobacterium]|uniref:phage portal protein n=1 Tax=unclassified Fusobacterium TaxID=2648384 RepID=UPI001B8C5EEA|nr:MULTISPECIES: phage portal protein [unclassified Fusobacterium]MBR8701450.1 hypothetical protein [Fusobacterium sp. DD45]MBR8711218.1 hypothetical protein [Fusobacterium sp. DD28]MBR8751789.1 hypothetical protein [Fusobacterium sp. DD26]
MFENFRLARQIKTEIRKLQLKELKMRNEIIENYAQSGASTTRKAFRGSYDYINTVDEDTGDTKDILTARSLQLFMSNPISRGAIEKVRTNVVGRGLKPKPKIDNKMLNLSNVELEKAQQGIQTLWNLWAETTECDIARVHNFYQLQNLAILTWLVEGECFALLPFARRKGEIFETKVRFIDGNNCQSQMNDNYIKNGVEFNKNCEPVAYYFKDINNEYKRVPTFSSTGRRNLIHLFEKERINQRRGVPFLSPVLETLQQLSRYSNAELTNAVLSSLFTVFITSDKDTQSSGKIGGVNFVQNKKNPDEKEINLGSGNLFRLNPGERLEFANPDRPNTNYENFCNIVCKQIGAALGIPQEVLLSSFNASYSASKASLLEAWKMYTMRRTWLINNFCQPIYETFVDECVARGLIELNGYTDNAIFRRAYLQTEWYGQTQGQIDPNKEVKAAILKIDAGLSTLSREAMELNGSNWSDNLEQRKLEILKLNELAKIKKEVRK